MNPSSFSVIVPGGLVCLFAIICSFITIPSYAIGEYQIPSWLKNNARWWSDGQISDSDFTEGIKWLLEQGIMTIPSQTNFSISSSEIPTWIKSTAKLWSENRIDDIQFASAVQYLVEAKIIDLGTPSETTSSSNAPLPTNQTKLADLYSYALQLVNNDRKAYGLLPVLLGNVSSAQNHADDMLNAQYFSHWNTRGVKPYATYTESGGRGLVSENAATEFSYCSNPPCTPSSLDPYAAISKSEYSMMYNDSGSRWEHKDNILNPYHTHVNFGVAYDNNHVYFTEQFQNNIVVWNSIKLINGLQLLMIGNMPAGFSLASMSVYADPSPQSLTGNELNGEPPYNLGYYDSGDIVGVILERPPPNHFYKECSPAKITVISNGTSKCVDYVIFDNKSSYPNGIDISVDVSKWVGNNGLHTVYLSLNDPKGNEVQVTSLTLEYLK